MCFFNIKGSVVRELPTLGVGGGALGNVLKARRNLFKGLSAFHSATGKINLEGSKHLNNGSHKAWDL
jgi:hypothetical protein